MKKIILNLALAGTIMIAAASCNSTKSVSGGADSTMTDSTTTPVDTTAVPVDTTRTTPPDTTIKPM
ncbi:MAG: coproporphyrinogen III oxidase [Pedobacter sp.]